MTNLRVDNIKNQNGSNGPVISSNIEFDSNSHVVLPRGTTAQRPSNVSAGSIRYNTETKELEYFNGTDWITLNSHAPGRGLFGLSGGTPASPALRTIEYCTITTTGNTSHFGELNTDGANEFASCSSGIKGLWGGGTGTYNVNWVVNFATLGNAITTGSLTERRWNLAACSNSSRGIFMGGNVTAVPANTQVEIIDYVTLSTCGDALYYGRLGGGSRGTIGDNGFASSIRGFNASGTGPGDNNIIQFLSIPTKGTADDFGDLNDTTIYYVGGCSNSTRGVYAGGTIVSPTLITTSSIQYITMSVNGNSISFGTLSQSRAEIGGTSSRVRGVFAGGYSAAPYTARNIVDYLTIANLGSNIDFGDLSRTSFHVAACSDSHGGLE